MGAVLSTVNLTSVLVYTLPPTCVAAISGYFSLLNQKQIQKSHAEIKEINKAVNGTPEGEPTLREEVKEINTAVNTVPDGQVSMREDIKHIRDVQDADAHTNT